jgi:hypothetical protein
MDNNIETPETSDSNELSFGKEIAKSLVISTVVSTGVVAGFVVVGHAMLKFEEFKKNRAAKKAAANENPTEN